MKPIPFARPYTGKKEIKLVSKAIKSGWLTTGKLTSKFEKEFAKKIGKKYALAVNSATAGLHLALEAAGIKAGDKVITTTYTFTATAEVVHYLGAELIFVDTIENSNLIDPQKIEEAIKNNKNVKAVIPVHIAGASSDMTKIKKICKRENIFCLEDAAHAFPAQTENGMLGTVGDVGVYSFYATKTITTGEGGMIVTDDPQIAKRIKSMRLHGIDRDVWDRFSSTDSSWEYDVIAPGYKYNLTDLASAIGLIQLNKADKMLEMRRALAKRYQEGLKGCKGIEIPTYSKYHSWHLFIIKIDKEKSLEAPLNEREKWINRLKKAGIGTSVHYKPLHLMKYYKKRYSLLPTDFPNALTEFSRSFSLPLSPGLKKREINYIIKKIWEISKNNGK